MAYSCGYSSGFEPDSLFITHPRHGTGNTEKHGKDRESNSDLIHHEEEYSRVIKRRQTQDESQNVLKILLFLFLNKFVTL